MNDRFLEVPEDEFFSYDWQGREIYVGEAYYNFKGDLVLEDDIDDYLREVFLMDVGLQIAGE